MKAIEQQNTVNPSGQVGAEPALPGQQFTYTMRAQGLLVTPEDFVNVIVRENPDDSVLRLRDLARVELGAQVYQRPSGETVSAVPGGSTGTIS